MRFEERHFLWALLFSVSILGSCAEKKPPMRPVIPSVSPTDTQVVYRERPEITLPGVQPEAYAILEKPPTVRVLVQESKKSLSLEVNGPHSISRDGKVEPLARKRLPASFAIRPSGKELVLSEGGHRLFSAPQVAIYNQGQEPFYLDGKPYRGSFIFLNRFGAVAAINILEIDEYLKGVLPSEIGHLGENSFEAYRAQAIAARSYAISKLEEKSNSPFDLNSTVMDQVYTGVSGENEIASRAVDATRGLVCFFMGKCAITYYCSCCGGHTADIRLVWPWKTPYPYLYGIRDTVPETGGESLCRGSRHFRWRVNWKASSLGSILRQTIPKELGISAGEVGKLLDLRLLGRSRDGRVEGLEFVTDRGSFVVRGDRIRWVMKPDASSDAILRSTLFDMDLSYIGNKVSSVDLLGGGNGHGVGMCQSGAIRMAQLGYSGEQIIYHYFPGVRIVTLYR